MNSIVFARGTALFPLLMLATLGCTTGHTVVKKPEGTTIVKVKTVVAVQKAISKTTVQPATILPYYETEIRSKVTGYVAEVLVDIGDVVQAGQPLAVVDVPEMQQQRLTVESKIALLQSQEQEAEAGVELATATVQAEEAKLQQARSQLLEQEALLVAAEAEFRRTQDLVSRGSLQQRLLDEAQKKHDSAKASQAAALSAVHSAEAEVAVAEARKAGAEAQKQTAAAQTQVTRQELAELEVLLAYAEIKAPFSGMITRRQVDLGELIDGGIQEGSSPLFVLSQVDKVRVHVPVPEIDAPFVQPGDALTLSFPSFASEPAIKATVTRLNGSLDPSTRTITAESVLENPDGKLLPGMFGEAAIDLETQVAATMLPSRAVRFDESGKAFVYIVDSQNKIHVSEVATGLDTGTEIEILSGLESGQTVVGSHLKRFSEDQQVEPL